MGADEPCVRIGMLDPAGTGLAVALGLVELGHTVAYVPAEPTPGGEPGAAGHYARELIERCLGGPAGGSALDRADLLVLWDGFADSLRSLQQGHFCETPFDPAHPFRATINPLAYPLRLERYLRLAGRGQPTVIVDCSDRQGPREPAFEACGATLLAREVSVGDPGPWRPFPFLYHPLLLWLEWTQPRARWFLPQAERRKPWSWVFCGTIDHPRYGGRRIALLNEVVRRWPGVPYVIPPPGSPVGDVLRILQSTGSGLDLPGAGEICYRLHECLALDVPLFRPWDFTVQVPAALAAACVRDPADLAAVAAGAARALYEEHLSPRVAAAALLAAVRQAAPAMAGYQ